MPAPAEIFFREAIASLQSGRLEDAERGFKKVLKQQPRHVPTLNLLTAVLSQANRHAEAERYIKLALQLDQTFDAGFYNYGLILKALKRPDEALAQLERASRLNPSVAETWNSIGAVLNDLGRYGDAIVAFEKAIALRRDFAEPIHNMANSLMGLRRHDEALAAYDGALALNPRFAEAWLGRGKALVAAMRDDGARDAYRRALALKPNLTDALCSASSLALAGNDVAQALDLACRAFGIEDTLETRAVVAACLQSPLLQPGGRDIRSLLLRAVKEAWVRPSTLASACAVTLLSNDAVRASIDGLKASDFRSRSLHDMLQACNATAIAGDALLLATLESFPVSSPVLEQFANDLRFMLLAAAREGGATNAAPSLLGLYSAIARQCFINSYVFAETDEEAGQVNLLQRELVAKIESGAAVPATSILALAAYRPLHTLLHAERLLPRKWPDSVAAVLDQQLREHFEEQRLRAAMPVLTPIDDAISLEVRDHYEEHPYPQWIRAEGAGQPVRLDAFLADRFPDATFVTSGNPVAILVAGCGTGRSAIQTAQRFSDASVLAIDLSLTSLAYAQRKARALGIRNLTHAQADIMQLGSIERRFDMIESSGVLHHLADPFAAWRILLSLLKPGGVMQIALYSEIARRDIVAVREIIAERGYRPMAADIRRCRQELLAGEDGTRLKNVTLISDFYSLSDCRDLLFHTQEHRMSLPQIQTFLHEAGLRFLGFDIDAAIARKYRQRFPNDTAMTDLAQWDAFERDNPYTFISMYQFWVQKV